MPDLLYNSLIGNVPSDQDTLRLADALRHRNQMGQLGVLSGDKVLSGVGGGLLDDTASQVESLAKTRQATDQRRVLENYYKAQAKQGQDNLQERYFADILDYLKDNYRTDAIRDAAHEKVEKKPQFKQIPASVQKRMEDLGGIARGVNELKYITPYKQEWESVFPGVRPLKNAVARNAPAFASPTDIESQAWQQSFKQLYELSTRHTMFGATLNAHEKAEWDKATINGNMTKAQVDTFLNKLENWTANQARGEYNGGVANQYDPEAINGYMNLPGTNMSGNTDIVIGQDGKAVKAPANDILDYEVVSED